MLSANVMDLVSSRWHPQGPGEGADKSLGCRVWPGFVTGQQQPSEESLDACEPGFVR